MLEAKIPSILRAFPIDSSLTLKMNASKIHFGDTPWQVLDTDT